jgi:hypothetical protein
MNKRFNSKPSPVYKQAVQACLALLSQEGSDAVRRACAEANWEAVREEYLRIFNLKPSHRWHVCVHRLMGKRCPNDNSHLQIPGADHLSEWKTDHRTSVIVSQPYRLPFELMKQIVDFCEVHDLRADAQAEWSWHFPGSTLMIAFRRRELKETNSNRE